MENVGKRRARTGAVGIAAQTQHAVAVDKTKTLTSDDRGRHLLYCLGSSSLFGATRSF